MIHTIVLFIVRVLKKTTVLKHVTVNVPAQLNKRRTIIPLHREIGYPNLFIEEDFLSILFKLFLPAKPGVFIDVGVNIGQTLLKVKTVDQTRSYIGFEPNKICADYTTNLIRLNKYDNCEIRPYALSDRRKRVKLSLNEDTDAAASIIANLRPDYFKDSILIDCLPFDESGVREPIAVVKIDVEGAELDVLLGMQKAIDTYQPLIICEVLDCYSADVLRFTQERADRLCQLLREHEYIIFQLHQDKKRIKKFERVDSITIQVWSPASYTLNDYLFCHAECKKEMLQLLDQLTSV